ncbi:MAG: DUF5343 domain-containing protein [Gammaproteobacteria bacterium]|nr:DUF5343 domain-containing protein [Gammaproteobacteria bacterium]MBU2058571.1 DUF5343 domain-containing protein [Gammaproteobacteria bacterium]MBU2173523.1 DUF5343 domain-containing protein [Gammaproteobacteria bacterium]MBU2246477.1 DUF5343 domain-containing protein [Gammaproteobacteria bacterium]MBU2344825.1 DUF5343 domain-containing protein [Gammaproteobacteria bacterium]
MAENLPYSTSVGTLEKILEKIKSASVPERFTQDFVNTKLAMKGGTANACIPILKKMGLVGGDGSPTELYREYRNPKKARTALGKAFKRLYERLYEMNEYIHDADDGDVLGLIVECTGSEKNSTATKYTLSTFNMLRKHADFELEDEEYEPSEPSAPNPIKLEQQLSNLHQPNQNTNTNAKGINLSYTINLNLPATKDIEVFNAIFKSLKQHILDQ